MKDPQLNSDKHQEDSSEAFKILMQGLESSSDIPLSENFAESVADKIGLERKPFFSTDLGLVLITLFGSLLVGVMALVVFDSISGLSFLTFFWEIKYLLIFGIGAITAIQLADRWLLKSFR